MPKTRVLVRLLYLRVRVADVDGPQSSVEGRGNHGVASRGGGASASGRTPDAGLGRSGRSRGAGPMVAGGPARSSADHPGNVAGMASSSAATGLDLPASARAPSTSAFESPNAGPEPRLTSRQSARTRRSGLTLLAFSSEEARSDLPIELLTNTFYDF